LPNLPRRLRTGTLRALGDQHSFGSSNFYSNRLRWNRLRWQTTGNSSDVIASDNKNGVASRKDCTLAPKTRGHRGMPKKELKKKAIRLGLS